MIDWSKPVRTRDGREARVYSTDSGGTYPVHGAIKSLAGVWHMNQWTSSGECAGFRVDTSSDLVNVPRRVKVDCWLNVFDNGVFCGPWTTKREADMGLGAEFRIACIHVEREVEEGEGL